MSQPNQQIAKAAGLIGVATFSSRILGFVRDIILARLFGAGMVADAFFVAYRIPNMLRELFAEGSMSAAFIPVFTETLSQKGRDEARRLASATFTLLLITVSLITVLAILLAPWIVRVIAPGFMDEAGKFNLTVVLSQLMFPFLLFISLGALAMGMLNSLRSFAAPAFSPVLFNVVIILCALWLSPALTEPIFGVAIGVTLGGLAQFLVQLPSLRNKGMLPSLTLDLFTPGVKRIGWLLLPSIVGLSVVQVNILVSTILATYLPEGSQSFLFYGMRMVLFPLGIFGVALGTAILPAMAHLTAQGNMDEMKKTLSFGLRLVSFVIIPSMVGLMVLRVPIVKLFFEHGEFTAAATVGVAGAIFFYSIGLPAFAGIRIVVAAFYSLQDTRTPVRIAVAAMVANVILSLTLMGPMLHHGLALATALSAILNVSLLIFILNRRLSGIDWPAILRSLRNTVLATIPVGIIAWYVSSLEIWIYPSDLAVRAVWLLGGIAIAVLAYILTHRLLKSEEQTFLWDMVKKRLAK